MRVRPVLAAVAVVAATASASAAGPQARSCRLVSDARGDVYTLRGYGVVPAIPDETLDVVSADVASDDAHLTAVVRVVDLALPAESSPIGSNYQVDFHLGGSPRSFALLASASPTLGQTYRLLVSGGEVPVEGHDVTGVFDVARDEVRIHVDLETLARWHVLERGHPVVVEGAFSGRGARGEGPFADEAAGVPRTYRAGTPSCVAIGR